MLRHFAGSAVFADGLEVSSTYFQTDGDVVVDVTVFERLFYVPTRFFSRILCVLGVSGLNFHADYEYLPVACATWYLLLVRLHRCHFVPRCARLVRFPFGRFMPHWRRQAALVQPYWFRVLTS